MVARGCGVIELVGVSKAYRSVPVLRGVSLSLERGEKALLLGANGAGKSTLLRVAAGLITPDKGAVRAAGAVLTSNRRAAAARIGYVAHAPLVYPDLTAAENLRFTAALYGVPENEAAARVDACLDAVGLDGRSHVRTLSQGQLRRLALARALVHDPPVLLLDEPFASLDGDGRERLTAWLAAAHDRTVLLATHQLDFAPDGADRVFVLEEGAVRTQANGRRARVPHDCATPRAARSLPSVVDGVRLLVAKDLTVELRRPLRFQSLVLFGVTLAVIVGYAFREDVAQTALPAAIWLLAVFLQLFFVGHAYRAEAENGCLDALLAAPLPRASIALAKTIVGALLAGVPTLLALGVLAWLTGSLGPLLPGVLVPLAVETVGMVAAGSAVFATVAAGEEPAADLHALVLLIVSPLIFFGYDLTHAAFAGATPAALVPRLALLAAYLMVLVGGAALAYGAFGER